MDCAFCRSVAGELLAATKELIALVSVFAISGNGQRKEAGALLFSDLQWRLAGSRLYILS